MKKYYLISYLLLSACNFDAQPQKVSKVESTSIQTMRFVNPTGYSKEELNKALFETQSRVGGLLDKIDSGVEMNQIDTEIRKEIEQMSGAKRSYFEQIVAWKILSIELPKKTSDTDRLNYYTELLIKNNSKEYSILESALKKLEGEISLEKIIQLNKKIIDNYKPSTCEGCENGDLGIVDQNYNTQREQDFLELKQFQDQLLQKANQ